MVTRLRARRLAASAPALLFVVFCLSGGAPAQERPYAERVEIRRTAYGVPHIRAEDLGAVAYGLAWCHMEDYGPLVTYRLTRARGELARHFGRDSLESDFWWRRRYLQAVRAYPALHRDARALYEGYAAAVNDYVAAHREEFPDWVRPEYTAYDVAAHWVDETIQPKMDKFLESQEARRQRDRTSGRTGDGSNAWAFGPERTASGKAILLRNPHLRWGAGKYSAYYEAHITVPGVIDFYGDFRVGYPMYFNGGFNPVLGWATTDNSPDIEEIYALDVDPERPDHYRLDGASVPLERETFTIAFRNGPGLATETREFWHTSLGPVVDRADGNIYVLRTPDWGEFRRTEQFLRMMQATTLEEWKRALRMRAHTEQNLVYADREGNVYYVWNAAIPVLPHESGRDTAAVPIQRSSEAWTDLVPFDDLPQLLNPAGGYVHNENDSFHFANLNEPLATPEARAAWPEPRLRLRSQLALELVHGETRLSLEDVIRLKHSPRMLLADRLKDDLVRSVRETNPEAEVAAAIDLVDAWDGRADADSRGAVLFADWWERYEDGLEDPFREAWSEAAATATPRGLGHRGRAVEAFREAVVEARRRYGDWGVAWGDVYRVRWGDVDVPVGGCPASLGCFRHIGFETADDGKRVADTGDAWILAVEFGETPRAQSVLVFGQTMDPSSPHFDDQAELFARGELKPVAFTEEEIAAGLVRRYRPGPAPPSGR